MKKQIKWQAVFSIPSMLRRIGVVIVFTRIILFDVQVASAQEILDHENAPIWQGGATNILSSNEVGQSFKPFCNNLSRVDVALI